MAETISSLQKLSKMEDGLDLKPTQKRPEVTPRVVGTTGRLQERQRERGTEETDGRMKSVTERRVETRVTISSNSQRPAETDVSRRVRERERERRERERERERVYGGSGYVECSCY